AVDRLCPCGAGDAKCRRADGNGKRLAAEKVVAARHALRLALHVTHSPHLVKHPVCFALVRPLTVASSPSARCATRGPLQTPAFRMNRFSQPLQFHRIRHAVEHTHRPANTTNEKTSTRKPAIRRAFPHGQSPLRACGAPCSGRLMDPSRAVHSFLAVNAPSSPSC